MTYRDSIIQKAIIAFIKMDSARKVSRPMFITLREWSGGPKVLSFASRAESLDEAALEAIENEDYAGTVLVDIDETATMLDLRAHGEAIMREREEEDQAERNLERENKSRFDRR